MLRIRLQRPGRAAKRRYNRKIIVIERTAARDSEFVAQVGCYDPSRELLRFDIAQYENWVKKGARPTETVASLFKRFKKQSS